MIWLEILRFFMIRCIPQKVKAPSKLAPPLGSMSPFIKFSNSGFVDGGKYEEIRCLRTDDKPRMHINDDEIPFLDMCRASPLTLFL